MPTAANPTLAYVTIPSGELEWLLLERIANYGLVTIAMTKLQSLILFAIIGSDEKYI